MSGDASMHRCLTAEGRPPTIVIVNDNLASVPSPIGAQIRQLRKAAGLTLESLARRAGTSAPTLHRYESGWDRFEVATLRRIASALGVHLEIRFVPARDRPAETSWTRKRLVKLLAPLFWDRSLRESDLGKHASWVLGRVLTAGDKEQVRAARAVFGDEALLRAIERRDVDSRTRKYWRLILEGGGRASQGPRV